MSCTSVYYKQKRYKEALADDNQAIMIDPQYVNGYIGRSITNSLLEMPDEALADINQALALAPSNASAYYWRGYLYKLRHEREAAIADFRQARDLSQDSQERQKAIDALNELGAS
jgi:tetratricopeptide (TPR) repeat protein